MSRRLSIDEEVAGGLLRLLGYASYSMSRAHEPEDHDTVGRSNSPPGDPDPDKAEEPEEAAPSSAAEQLFGLLKLASRGESPPARSSSPPELGDSEPETVSVRPERTRSSATRPTEKTWRRALTLSPREVTRETRQVILWLEAYIALGSTAAEPSNHGEES